MDAARFERAARYQPFTRLRFEHSLRRPFRLTPVAGLSRLVSYFFAGAVWYRYTVFAAPLNHLNQVMALPSRLEIDSLFGRYRIRTCGGHAIYTRCSVPLSAI